MRSVESGQALPRMVAVVALAALLAGATARATPEADARGNVAPVAYLQQGPKLTAGGELGQAAFGVAVALSADGDTTLVGAPGDGGGAGSVRFFTRAGATWSERMPLLGDKTDGRGLMRFGAAVSVSADGGTALIGGPGDAGSRGSGLGLRQIGVLLPPAEVQADRRRRGRRRRARRRRRPRRTPGPDSSAEGPTTG